MSTPPINAMQAQSSRGQRGGYSRGGGRGRGNGGLRAPLQQFRSWKGGILSVTDLVGPSWSVHPTRLSAHSVHLIWSRCELQFDYALRQQRHRKLADRPASFVTAEGKTIHVAQDLASQNDRTVARGKVGRTLTVPENIPNLEVVYTQSPRTRSATRQPPCASDDDGGALGSKVPLSSRSVTRINAKHML